MVELELGRTRTEKTFSALGEGGGWSVDLVLDEVLNVPLTCIRVSGTHWI